MKNLKSKIENLNMRLVYPLFRGIAFLSLCTSFSFAQQSTKGFEGATAQDSIEYKLAPVIVSATQAVERLTPATFSNLSRRQLQQRYSTQDVPVLLSDLPSTTFYSENGNGLGYNYINLRGFEQRRLSVMVNGIPQNDPEDHGVYWIDMPDLLANAGTVQVQRGAGSAFYGPPAIGGSVNIVTNPFLQKPGVELESMFGFQEYGSTHTVPLSTRKYAASVNSGLIGQQYMVYGRLATITTTGYRTNGWDNLNSYFLGAVRFDENMTTRIHIYGGPFTDGLVYTGLPKFVNSNLILRRENLSDWGLDSTGTAYGYKVERRPQESESFTQPHYEILNEWKLSPTTTLFNTLFYVTGDGYYDYDASWADTTMLRLGYAYGIPTLSNPANTLVRAFVGNKQWGWLPRIEIDHGAGTLTLGAEIRIHRSVHWGKIQWADSLPPSLDPDYHFYQYNGEKDIFSFYVHELFHVDAKTTATADVQLIRNRYGIANEKYLGYNFSLPYFFVNPRVGVNYNMSELWNAYVSFAYTSREPTLANLYAAEGSYYGETPAFQADTTGGVVKYDFTKPFAKPEQLIDVETGTGYRSSIARLSVDAFWMEFQNELVKSGKVDIFGQPVTGNAQRTRHIGFEADGALRISNDLLIGGNISLSRNRLVEYSVFNDEGVRVSLNGNPIAGFPDVLGNFRVTYSRESFSASAEVKYVGAFYTDNFKNEANKNDAYTVANAQALYDVPLASNTSVTLRGEVRNIFDALYTMSGEGNAFFPAAERNYVLGMTLHL
ncbi:MAG: TonB-dependent receptor [Bacteroidota bacterium]|nr:TonB-dependent receptor [Bacteroidota bacterium]